MRQVRAAPLRSSPHPSVAPGDHAERTGRPAIGIADQLIDLFTSGQPFLDDPVGLVDCGHEDTVGDEPPYQGILGHHDRVLATPSGELDHRIHGIGRGLIGTDDLGERADLGRRGPVPTDDSLRPVSHLGQGNDGEARGVGGQDDVGLGG